MGSFTILGVHMYAPPILQHGSVTGKLGAEPMPSTLFQSRCHLPDDSSAVKTRICAPATRLADCARYQHGAGKIVAVKPPFRTRYGYSLLQYRCSHD
jgi:hypothetical protein